MVEFQQITTQPEYNSKASSFSKLIIAVFFATYVYMVITASGDAGGWLWPVLFIIVGLFASSIIIAMPLFILKRMFPKVSILITIAGVVITFFITRILFLWFLR